MKKTKNPPQTEHVCHICGRVIIRELDPEPVYIKTKRGTGLWIHKTCFRRGINK